MNTHDVIAMEAEANRLTGLIPVATEELIVVNDTMDIAVFSNNDYQLSERYPNKNIARGEQAIEAHHKLMSEGKQVTLMKESRFIQEKINRLKDYLTIDTVIAELSSKHIDKLERLTPKAEASIPIRH
jgi:hypothetical protein